MHSSASKPCDTKQGDLNAVGDCTVGAADVALSSSRGEQSAGHSDPVGGGPSGVHEACVQLSELDECGTIPGDLNGAFHGTSAGSSTDLVPGREDPDGIFSEVDAEGGVVLKPRSSLAVSCASVAARVASSAAARARLPISSASANARDLGDRLRDDIDANALSCTHMSGATTEKAERCHNIAI